ncbi:MAG: hypothetical protein GQ542_04525 [Desulforhopalus sp.]|nr:hypothetical protein [Desulforhopalus sp.]
MLRKIIPLCILIFATVYILRWIPYIDLSMVCKLRFNIWLTVLLLFAICQLFHIFYFSIILGQIHKISSLYRLAIILFASYSLNYAGPFKIGIPARVFLFKRILGIPLSAGTAAVLTTTCLDVLVMVTLALGLSGWIYLGPFAGLLIGIAAVSTFTGFITLLHRLPRKFVDRYAWIASLVAHMNSLSAPILAAAVFISVAKCLINSFAGWLVLTELGGTVRMVEFSFAYFSSVLAGLLSFLPMGIAVRDASLVEFLSHLGTPPSTGIVFVGIDRLVWSLLPLFMGLLAGWQLGVRALIKSADKEVST